MAGTPKTPSLNVVSEWLNHHKFLLTLFTGTIAYGSGYVVSAEEFKAYSDNQGVVDTQQSKAITVLDYEFKLTQVRSDIDFLADSEEVLTDKERRQLDRLQRDEKRYEDKLNDS